jgi:hypothetical protein
LGSGGALAFQVRVTRCPPFAGGAEDTMGALRVGQFGTAPEKELLVRACASFSASLRLRACSSLWVGVRSGVVLQPVQPICIAPAIAIATRVKKGEEFRWARIPSKKREFTRRSRHWNRARARISFRFKTLARFARFENVSEKTPLAHSGARSTIQRTCSRDQWKKKRFRLDDGVFQSNMTDPRAFQAWQS